MSTIDMSPYYSDFIQKEIASGRYRNEIEVIQASLALLEKEHSQNFVLASALSAGEASGLALPFDNQNFKSEMKLKHHK